jgi:hypothetical protein
MKEVGSSAGYNDSCKLASSSIIMLTSDTPII